MYVHKKPEPLQAPVLGVICPVCGKRAYSLGGIHPQCAVQLADAPRQKKLVLDRRAAEAAKVAAPRPSKTAPKAGYGRSPMKSSI